MCLLGPTGPYFIVNRNYPSALKYSKLAYELCPQTRARSNLADFKEVYLESGAEFAKLLRFAVGDEVEFLHELETESEWRRGRVVELYFRDNSFKVIFTAPYLVQLLEGIES